jgi:hypothetical protein
MLEPRRFTTLWASTAHTDTQTDWRDFFNQAIEVGSGAVIYVASFIKIGSGVQMLIGGYTHKDKDSNVISQAYSIFSKYGK